MNEVVWCNSEALAQKIHLVEILSLLGLPFSCAPKQNQQAACRLIELLSSHNVSLDAFKRLIVEITGGTILPYSMEWVQRMDWPLDKTDE